MVSLGAQDAYLTGADGQRFWKAVYHRHTNYAVESIPQVFSGKPSYGSTATCILSRSGDLVVGLVAEITLKRGAGEQHYPAEHLLKDVELEIGGMLVDRVTNTWLRIYDELYRGLDEREAYRLMTTFTDEPTGCIKRFYVPLPFWFSRGDVSVALPVISLQYHDIRLRFNFESAKNIPGIDASYEPEIRLWADFVYLDNVERRWFAQESHEYLIDQTQFMYETIQASAEPVRHNITLTFNHPVKFLAWVVKPDEYSHGVFTSYGIPPADRLVAQEVYGVVHECGLQLNGQDRLEPRKGSYFRLLHPATLFKQAPSVGVYVMCFALDPRSRAPSGSLNFSRVDAARLNVVTKAAVLAQAADVESEDQTLADAASLKRIEIYACNHNVLRVTAGMGGLMFSN